MEMMNSCSVIIPFKYVVFRLEFSWVLDEIDLMWEFALNLNLWVSYAWSKSRYLTDMIWECLSCYLRCSKWRLNFGDLSFEKYKCNMMRSCMTKFEFLPEPNMISRLGKLPLIYAACIALSLVKLCWSLWEVCLSLKIKITYTPPTYALLLHWG